LSIGQTDGVRVLQTAGQKINRTESITGSTH
jgi:hypothetical protein